MENFLRLPVWYPILEKYTFNTLFLELTSGELTALENGEESGGTVEGAIEKLKPLMAKIPGNAFVSVDSCSPTDTERFENKRGAVFSASSAWNFLARSNKIREAVKLGTVTAICVRPFRRINKPREFRLFVKNGRLAAASQYNLIRHFRRLEGVKEMYWTLFEKFVNNISEKLECATLVIDVYVTSGKEILIVDLNEFGAPTKPLLLRKWELEWENIEEPKLKLMQPPLKISGEVKISF